MLGVAVFAALIAAFVIANSALDRGARERRRVRRSYPQLLRAMGKLEESDVRIYEIDGIAARARWLPLKWLIGPGLITVTVLLVQTLTGIPPWIPAVIIGLYALRLSAAMWIGLRRAYGDPEGKGDDSEDWWELLGIFAKAIVVAVGILFACQSSRELNSGSWLVGVALSIAAVVAVTYCYVPVTWIERAARRKREVSFATDTGKQAVLFLRSFGDDDFRLFTPVAAIGPRFRFVPGRQRFEEFVAANLTGSGNARFIAIGRPGERMTTLGASRTYWTDETWRDAVTQTAARTQALIVMAGSTVGLDWEMQHLSSSKLLGKALVLLPPGDADGSAARYEFICTALEIPERERLPKELVQYTLTGLRFDQNGAPIHYLGCGREWASYSATITQFMGTISGGLNVRARHTLSEDTKRVRDVTAQARTLLKRGARREARALIKSMLAESRTTRALLSATWFSLAAGDSNTVVLALFAEARDAAPTDDLVQAVGAMLLDNPRAADPDKVFWLLDPDRRPLTAVIASTNTVHMRRGEAAPLLRALVKAEEALEERDFPTAVGHANEARQAALKTGQRAAVARATVVLGGAFLAAGNVTEAESLASEVASMRNLDTLSLGVHVARVRPEDTVDQAYDLLVDVSLAGGDSDRILAALHALREFRVDNSLREQAADAALRLAKQYDHRGDLRRARRWAATARSEYESMGRVLDATEAGNLLRHH